MVIDISLVQVLPLFRQTPPEALEKLLARATARRAAQDTVIFEQGRQAEWFYLLVQGRLKVWHVTPEGQQVMVRVVHPGELFGFARALSRTDYPGTARAAVDSLMLCWPTGDWDRVIEMTPQMALSAVRNIGQQLDEAHTRLRELQTQQVERRIAHAILRLAEKSGRLQDGALLIDFPITRQDIAEMTGSTLHTVSRLLSAWEERGLVGGGRKRLTVLDRDGLARIADPDS